MSYSLQEFQSIKIYHRADQGPCPRGFHIGSKAEWQSLIDALTTLGVYNVSDIPTVLNIPSAYYLARSNGALETRYGIARYWTSTMTSNTVAWAWGIDQNPTIVFQEDKPGNAFSIRPFKDEPVVPDSSWTESPSGIFKNTTLGLISIQDGSNWITISDKNLGATNVGDDGLYYQFGNNYGFTVNPTPYYTSKVSNTQAYGPSNYYNDDHFVRVSSGNNWFTDTNNNIRGGVDTTSLYPIEAKEVWLGNNKVRPAGWTPGANTIAYYDFETDTTTLTNKASTGGTYNGTYYSTPTFGTLASGKKYFDCRGNNYAYTPVLPFNWSGFTLNMRIYIPTQTHEWYTCGTCFYNVSDYRIFEGCYNGRYQIGLGNYTYSTNYSNLSGWKLHTLISDGSNIYIYINGRAVVQQTYSVSKVNTDNFGIGMLYEQKHQTAKCFEGYFGCVMFENKTRTAQDVADYYNLTKGDYGL